MEKVSVIIPVYNVEDYLEECLESIVNQSLKEIEIICINDGSTDNSLEILNRYASNYDNVKVFSQENKGPGASRNKGIDLAEGEYIYFMDSDDILELNALEELYQISKEKETDFIMFKLISFDDETKEKSTQKYYDMKKLKNMVGENVFSYKDLGEYVFYLAVSPPGKFFKASFLDNLRFPENILFEDKLFFVNAIFKAERVYFYDKYLYNRRFRKNSIMTGASKDHVDLIEIENQIFDYIKGLGLFGDYKNPLYNRKILLLYTRYTQIRTEHKQYFFDKFKEDLLCHKKEYEADEDFLKVLKPETKCVFYNVLESDDYEEFDYKLDLCNSRNDLEKLKKENQSYKDNLKKLEKSNDSLKKSLKKLKKENNALKSTKAYKFWRFYARFRGN